MKRFTTRTHIHDHIALPFVEQKLKDAGCSSVVTQGHEYDKIELRDLLKQRHDLTALLKRFKPDIIAQKDNNLFFCEVKNAEVNHSNYSIEFESYLSTKEHAKNTPVFYAFIEFDIASQKITKSHLCNAVKIPMPHLVFIPDRFDYLETVERIKNLYPSIHTKIIHHRNGSGTAFFLVPKNSYFFIGWQELFAINRNKQLNRHSTIIKISQCHLNPGWSVDRQSRLFDKYGVYTVADWDKLNDEQLRAMLAETV